LPAAAIASVTASADTSALTLAVELDLSRILGAAPSQGFAAVSGYNVYVIALVPGERLGAPAGQKYLFQLNAESNWGVLGSPVAAFIEGVAAGAADQRVRVELLRNIDARGLRGTEFYIGYGTSDIEMIQAQRYRGVFIIP
jgi:hypothetical protein